MKTMEEIQAAYEQICVQLGDITVKMKGLENQKSHLFDQLDALDTAATKLQESKSDV